MLNIFDASSSWVEKLFYFLKKNLHMYITTKNITLGIIK